MTDIKSQLLNVGFNEDQAQLVIKDVSEVIAKKIFVAFFNKLEPTEREKVESMSQGQVVEFAKNQNLLTKEKINEIVDRTWDDYFNTLKT